MSKSVTRIVFSVLISLGVVVGVYTSVQGASLGANRAGTHLVSGAKVNLDHYRLTVAEQQGVGAQLDSLSTHQEGGHGCGADKQTSSDD